MIDERKAAEIVAMLRAGKSQSQVAKRYRITQQMVSKVWRKANGFKQGTRGGDRVSDRYRNRVERQQRKVKNG
jgi:DNA invertase Pin-like site-specific DNA recombinase